jgi:hypothetical protein
MDEKTPQHALQIWPLLVLAARSQHLLSYETVSKMTGQNIKALRFPLGSIAGYCKKRKLPYLNLLVVSTKTGKPLFDLSQIDLKDEDLSREQARVFVFDWIKQGVLSVDELKEARLP